MSKILIVDDDKSIRKLLEMALKNSGYDCILASTLQEANEKSVMEPIVLAILDLGLEDKDGKVFLQSFREWSDAPVIVLSARTNESEKLAAFELGADDYVTKPFSTPELIARIKAAIKRFSFSSESPIIKSLDLEIDLSSRIVSRNSNELKLTPKEYELLRILIQNSGKILTHNWLLKEVWGLEHQNETQYLRVFIKQLRQKIEEDPAKPRRIITETGIGYRFIA